MAVILFILAMLGFCPAQAAEAEPESLCLSDGQPLEAVVLDVRSAHRTVRIDQYELRIPETAIGSTCRVPAQSSWTEGVRMVLLQDGQTLIGTPLTRADGVSLVLLDGQKLVLPRDLVRRMRRAVLRTDPEPPERVLAAPEPRTAPSRPVAPSIAAFPVGLLTGPFGLGVVALALVAGILFGLHRVQEGQGR